MGFASSKVWMQPVIRYYPLLCVLLFFAGQIKEKEEAEA